MRSVLSLLRIAFIKIFNIRAFSSSAFEDFSLSTRIFVFDKGQMRLKRRIHTRSNVVFEADGGVLEIGEGCFFNNGCMVVAKEHVKIGNYTSFGPNVLVYDHDHRIDSDALIHDSGFDTAPVVIGDNVWIGANTVILRGTVLGNGCVVGAGSVVKGTYPPDTVIIQKRSEILRDRVSNFEKDVDNAYG
ncbi:MAG: acyltransferase [Oscillospiraceae bacterium]|nr:acyltransferase [Oscillospiraceae bacterium]